MAELIFLEIENYLGSSLIDAAKETETKISEALSDGAEMSRNEYAVVVAKILFERFGNKREESESKFIICEAVAMAIASDASLNRHFGPFEEKFLREDIRSKMNILGEES